MKKMFFVFVLGVVGIFMISANAFGQTLQGPFPTAEAAVEHFRQTGELKMPPTAESFQRSTSKTSFAAQQQPVAPLTADDKGGGGNGPGDARIFTVHQDREFAYKGQEITFTIIGATVYTGPISVVDVIYEPGISGQYDQTGIIRYYSPELINGGSYLQNGIVTGQMYKTYTRKFTQGDNVGQYILSHLFYDQNGVLLQQTFNYYYLNVSGPAGLYTWRVDNVIESSIGNNPVLIVKGKFPVGLNVYLTLGKPALGIPTTNYLASSADGQTILLLRQSPYYRAVEYDMTLLDTSTRICQTKIAAYTQAAAP